MILPDYLTLPQVWVHGDSTESSLVCVVIPQRSVLLDWAEDAGLVALDDPTPEDELAAKVCAMPEAAMFVLGMLQEAAAADKVCVACTLCYSCACLLLLR